MPKPTDIVFDREENRFNFRSVAVIIHESKVLLHRIGDNPYWSLPGGRVEFHEASVDTVIREMKEELGIDVTVVRPLWVMENFFENYKKRNHELSFYFLCEMQKDCSLLSKDTFDHMDGNSVLHFSWVPVDSLTNVELFPSFLRTTLCKLPQGLEYIVHRDTQKS